VFGTPGYVSELTPFGARWPDGSVRFAQLAVLIELGPEEEQVIDVRQVSTPAPPFTYSPWVRYAQPFFDVSLSVGVPGQGPTPVHLDPVSVLDDTNVVKTTLYRARVPGTDLVAELWLSAYSDADHMPFELRVTSSSTASTNWYQPIDSLELGVSGAYANLRAAARRGATVFLPTPLGPNRVGLLERETFFDGQGQEWIGEFHFHHPGTLSSPSRPESLRSSTLDAVVESPLWGVSLDWGASGALGPFGYVPPAPPWILDGGLAAASIHRGQFVLYLRGRGGPWDDWPLGLFPYPARTGDQHDFGAIKLLEIFASGRPYGIEEARINASEEALRPVHHREADGTPVLARNHPNWVAWDGRTHFSQTISPDRLGKPYPGAPVDANGWFGRDNEHWSSLTLASTYLLTRSPSLRYELDNEAELFVSSHTLPSEKPGFATNGMGAARGVGRALLSMSWNYLLTGNDTLRDRMVAWVKEVVWPTCQVTKVTGPVRPLAVSDPDSRILNREHWRPWEETIGILGLEAMFRVTGTTEAHVAAAFAASTTMTAGWLIRPEQMFIATGVGWKANGVPLTPQEYNDPTWVLWSYGTNFNEWAVSAIRLSMRYAVIYNDQPLLVRSMYVYGRLIAKRFQPLGNPGWDRFSEWEAVN
jgi:hypothetical protein